MKFFVILMVSFNLNAQVYVVPKDVVVARDSAVKSMEKFRNKILNRYFELSQKKVLSSQEKDELTALDIIIFEKDSNEYLKNRMKNFKKKIKNKK